MQAFERVATMLVRHLLIEECHKHNFFDEDGLAIEV
jgi:hypothetical protein